MTTSVTRQRADNANLLEYANKNRDQGFFSDVTIVAGNQTISANRLVLSCCSTYFEGMLKFQKNFTTENIIEIQNVNGKAFKDLIDFIYSGSITISEQNVMDLLSGAHYLQMHEVQQFCFEFLRYNTTVVNSLDFLKMADHCKNEGLTKEIQQYISTNFDEVLLTENFKQLSIEELISCISSLNRSQVEESCIFQAIVTWCNCDREARRDHFVKLFKMINLVNVAIDYMGKVVLEEKLLTNSPDCYKTALATYHQQLYKQKNKISETTYQAQVKLNLSRKTSKLISLGGKDSCKVTVVYDLLNESSVNYPDLSEKIKTHASLTLNDYIYCIGGDEKNKKLLKGTDKVWRLNLKKQTSTWKQVASMKTKRSLMGAAVYEDVIVVAGGQDDNCKQVTSTEVYQSSVNEWRTISKLKRRRCGHALVSCNDYLYVIGGWGGFKCLTSVERLGDLKGEWTKTEPMQKRRCWVAAVNCDGVVYAIGGRSGVDKSTALKTVEQIDSSTNKWKYVSDMNFKRSEHAACVLQNKIYVVGGLDADGKVVTQIECYDPMSDTWSIVGNTTEQLYYHSLVAV